MYWARSGFQARRLYNNYYSKIYRDLNMIIIILFLRDKTALPMNISIIIAHMILVMLNKGGIAECQQKINLTRDIVHKLRHTKTKYYHSSNQHSTFKVRFN